MRIRDAVLAFTLALLAPRAASADELMDAVLAQGGATLKVVMQSPSTYRFQVLYAEVKDGALVRHAYREDAEYFFPASSMKVPVTLAAYQGAGAKQWSRDAELAIYGASETVTTTLARETLRALVVSDNASANRLLAFAGHRETNESLWGFGLASARVRHGFSETDPAEVSPRMALGGVEIPARTSDLKLPANDLPSLAIGKAAVVDGKVVPGPMSFADKNQIRLRDLQDALVRILQPDALGAGAKPDTLCDTDREAITKILGTLPSESGLAGYQRNVVADYQLVPFLRGIERVKSRGHFEIHSKVGQAFGFLIENARITDKDTGKSFYLAAVIYADPDETVNDDRYAYDTVSFPVLADVAEAFCRHAFAP